MKHFDYWYSETWGGYVSVTAETREGADEKVRQMDRDELKWHGVLSSLSFEESEIGICSEWDEENTVYLDDCPWDDRRVKGFRAHPVLTLPKNPFSQDELQTISDALVLAIKNASQASELVTYAPAQMAIMKQIKTLRALNTKVCGMME